MAGAPRHWPRRVVLEATYAGLAALGAFAWVRISVHPLSAHVLGPALVCSLGGWAVAALLVDAGAPLSLSAPVAGIVVTLLALRAGVPGAFPHGLPGASTPGLLRQGFAGTRHALTGFAVPAVVPAGVATLGCLWAGAAGAAGRLLAGDRHVRRGVEIRRPLVSLLPLVVLAGWSAGSYPSPSVAILVGGVGAGAAAVLVQAELPRTTRGAPGWRAPGGPGWRAPGNRGWRAPMGSLGTVGIATAVAVGVALPLSLAPATARPGHGGSQAGPVPTALALVANLTGVEVHDSQTVMFTARTPHPSYWEVAVLPDFTGSAWVAAPGESSLAPTRSGSAGEASLVAPPLAVPAAPTYSATVHIDELASEFLPVPTGMVALSNLRGGPPGRLPAVTSGGTLASAPSKKGESYTVRAVAAPRVANLPTSTDAPSVSLSAYTALPSLPAAVGELAVQATKAGTAASPLAEAENLVDYFRSGLFTYSLDPPPTPAGANPVLAFLTTTRSGTCEQFAGAFAVLARAVGLPTRVVVGFTAGTTGTGGTTTVRGVDAHAWPEVYLGARTGWVSFEPTPAAGLPGQAPTGVVGPGATPSPPPSATATTVPAAVPTTVPAQVGPAQLAPPSGAAAPGSATGRAGGTPGPSPTGALVGALVGLVAILGGAGLLLVRRRRRQEATTRLLAAERTVERALRRSGAGRPPGQSPRSHRQELLESVAGTPGRPKGPADPALVEALGSAMALARRVEEVLYAERPPSHREARAGAAAARQIRRTLGRPRVRARLRAVAPRGEGDGPVWDGSGEGDGAVRDGSGEPEPVPGGPLSGWKASGPL